MRQLGWVQGNPHRASHYWSLPDRCSVPCFIFLEIKGNNWRYSDWAAEQLATRNVLFFSIRTFFLWSVFPCVFSFRYPSNTYFSSAFLLLRRFLKTSPDFSFLSLFSHTSYTPFFLLYSIVTLQLSFLLNRSHIPYALPCRLSLNFYSFASFCLFLHPLLSLLSLCNFFPLFTLSLTRHSSSLPRSISLSIRKSITDAVARSQCQFDLSWPTLRLATLGSSPPMTLVPARPFHSSLIWSNTSSSHQTLFSYSQEFYLMHSQPKASWFVFISPWSRNGLRLRDFDEPKRQSPLKYKLNTKY